MNETQADIIELQEIDLPELLKLYADPAFDDGQVLQLSEAKVIFSQIKQHPNYRLFGIRTQQRLIASYALLIMPNLGHLGSPSAIVEDVVVARDQQGQGLGQGMMQHAMTLAREAGCYKLNLSTNLKRIQAHGFYESLGFKKHGYSYHLDLI